MGLFSFLCRKVKLNPVWHVLLYIACNGYLSRLRTDKKKPSYTLTHFVSPPPQPLQYTRKSTEGVSYYLFALVILGNTMYGLSVLLKNPDRGQGEGSYVIHHLPWLIGSLGTLALDLAVSFTLMAGAGFVVIVVFKGAILYQRGVSVISLYKPFWKSASSDITIGRVHLESRCLLARSVLSAYPSGL